MSYESPYAHMKRQQEARRAQKSKRGEDTSMEDAEARHDAIYDWVCHVRFLGPMALTLALCAIGAIPDLAAPQVIGWVLASYVGARLFGAFVTPMLRAFRPRIYSEVHNLVLQGSGLGMAWMGFKDWEVAIGVCGLALVVMPYAWNRWSESVMDRTDFRRMRREMRTPSNPRILE